MSRAAPEPSAPVVARAGKRVVPGPRRGRAAAGEAGFSLLEVLVALAVMAAVIGAVAQLAGMNVRAARTLAVEAGLMETARAVETGIPPRGALAFGRTDGEIAGQRWRMDVRPLVGGGANGGSDGASWAAMTVRISVRAPTGEMVTLETLRLMRIAP